jgi:hypothetical protein
MKTASTGMYVYIFYEVGHGHAFFFFMNAATLKEGVRHESRRAK